MVYNVKELRDSHGRWARSLDSAIKGDTAELERLVKADRGPTRIQMPQLSGVPLPGSKADKLPHAPGQEVDLTDQFEKELRARGIKVSDTTVPVEDLHPTQDELVMSKVAGLAKFMLTAPKNSPVFEPIFVSNDNHVIDGHHRWAGRIIRDKINGTHENMAVRKVDLPIKDALKAATEFMDEWGLPRAGVNDKSSTVSNFAHPKVANLSTVYTLKETDLAFNPLEKRDDHGKWTRGGSHGVKSALPNPATVTLADGKARTLEQAVAEVGPQEDWPKRDKQGATQADLVGVHEQAKAQIVAQVFDMNVTDKDPADIQYEGSLWEQYQNPEMYQTINGTLRGTYKPKKGEPSAADLQKYAEGMFRDAGYTTQQPMSLWRAFKSEVTGKMTSGKHDWSKELTPGTVFTDKGMVSATAHSKFAAGWLEESADGSSLRKTDPTDVVMEIRVPKGTRVVGGNVEFIETMLPPGSKFKVVSAETKTFPAASPLPGGRGFQKKVNYTHVVAELIP